MKENTHISELGKFRVFYPSPDDVESLKKIFFNYPHKSFQQKFQKLNKDILKDFFAESFAKSIINENNQSFIFKDSENKIHAIAGLSHNSWHTQNFGMKMGRIAPFILSQKPEIDPGDVLDFLMKRAEEMNLRHVGIRFDADEWNLIHLCEKKGFYLVDCSVKFGLKMPSPIPPKDNVKINILPYSENYLDQIMNIAAYSHSTNHFYADPNLPKENTQKLFANWVKKLAAGNSQSIYIATLNDNVIGFIIFLENKRFNQLMGVRIAILDYIVLDSKLQGKGLGSDLLAATLKFFEGQFDHIELRTSHNNYPAVNLYEKFGFRLISTDIAMHKLV